MLTRKLPYLLRLYPSRWTEQASDRLASSVRPAFASSTNVDMSTFSKAVFLKGILSNMDIEAVLKGSVVL